MPCLLYTSSHAIALVEAEIKKYSESVYLEVAARNFGAMKLYHRLGYHCPVSYTHLQNLRVRTVIVVIIKSYHQFTFSLI